MTEATKKGDTVLRGGVWTTVSRIFTQLTQFAIFMVAVRLMTPAEFGVFALAAAVVVILTQVSMAGWSEYIMQWHGSEARIRETLFVAILCSFMIATMGVVGGSAIGRIVSDPIAKPLLQVLSVGMFFTSIGAAYNGVLVRQDRLTVAALTTLLADIANLIVAIWALYQGFGVMALAWGRLSGAVILSVSGLIISKTTPRMMQRETLADSVAFSWKIIMTRLVVNVRIYAATLIIGGFLGATSAGYYRAAQRIVAAFEEIVSEPTRILSWSLFRRSRDSYGDTSGFGELALRFYPVLYYGAVPLFVGVFLMADTLTTGILGPGWEPATPVLRILAVAALIRCSGTASAAILTLAGEVRKLPWIMTVYSSITIGAILSAASFGITAIALSEVVSSVIAFLINALIMKRYAGIQWRFILARSWAVLPALALSCIPIFLADKLGLFMDTHDLVRFVLIGLSMMVFFVPAVLLLDGSLRDALRNKSFSEHSVG
ncbi:oligosaccharide flippase family protein [Ruegeria atlantica]|uniref:oligosaccharide flippase family protein n=1 Tax=Ruegeria atlantica TaxID=81569 RepID=UPI00147AAC10|nr:oligosaccharide flippase family protein [Ruegeria atlantica]